jgi:hypothetical protein
MILAFDFIGTPLEEVLGQGRKATKARKKPDNAEETLEKGRKKQTTESSSSTLTTVSSSINFYDAILKSFPLIGDTGCFIYVDDTGDLCFTSEASFNNKIYESINIKTDGIDNESIASVVSVATISKSVLAGISLMSVST